MESKYNGKKFPYEKMPFSNEEKRRLAEEPIIEIQPIVQRHDALEKRALGPNVRPL